MGDFDITSLLEVSLAPAFLLVALGGLLNLYAIRLGRIVDRSRALQRRFHETEGEEHAIIVGELNHLQRRMRVVNSAIAYGVLGGLLVCVLIGLLFFSGLLRADWGLALAVLFIISMITLSLSLVRFFQEVQIASRDIMIRDEYLQ